MVADSVTVAVVPHRANRRMLELRVISPADRYAVVLSPGDAHKLAAALMVAADDCQMAIAATVAQPEAVQ